MAKKEKDVDLENKKADGKMDGKNAALDLAIQQITKQFGDGSIMKLGIFRQNYASASCDSGDSKAGWAGGVY